jgi:hypothetical protein
MTVGAWKKLPPDTQETCDRTSFGWSKTSGSSDRCGRAAAWIKRGTCGCGSCDMTIRHCEAHQTTHLNGDDALVTQAIQDVIGSINNGRYRGFQN